MVEHTSLIYFVLFSLTSHHHHYFRTTRRAHMINYGPLGAVLSNRFSPFEAKPTARRFSLFSKVCFSCSKGRHKPQGQPLSRISHKRGSKRSAAATVQSAVLHSATQGARVDWPFGPGTATPPMSHRHSSHNHLSIIARFRK